MIVVPHSQGNLFEIQSLSVLAAGGHTPTDLDAACVGMVPTASPTSLGYPFSSFRLRPVQMLGDVILNAPRLTGVPTFPGVSTPLYESLLGDKLAADALPLGFAQAIAKVKWIMDQFQIHHFIGSYLATVGARSLVQQAITDIYSNCEFGLQVSANPVLNVGATQQLSTTIIGADNRGLSPLAQVTWVSSDSTVATVDGNGVLTGIGEGMVRVTASYRGQRADAVVEVVAIGPDASVSVVVQNVSTDVVPFWLLGSTSQIWRRRDISVSVTPNDATTSVDFGGGIAGYDTYGRLFTGTPIESLTSDGSRTLRFSTVLFDDPRANGLPVRFAPDGRIWKMGDKVLITFHTSGHGQHPDKTHWIIVPLSNP